MRHCFARTGEGLSSAARVNRALRREMRLQRKGVWQKLARRGLRDLAVQIRANDDELWSAQLDHDLSASTAGRRRRRAICNHCNVCQIPRSGPSGDCREQRRAFGAIAQTVRSVFDIAAGEDASVSCEHCRADVEIRIRRVRAITRFAGSVQQSGNVRHALREAPAMIALARINSVLAATTLRP